MFQQRIAILKLFYNKAIGAQHVLDSSCMSLRFESLASLVVTLYDRGFTAACLVISISVYSFYHSVTCKVQSAMKVTKMVH